MISIDDEPDATVAESGGGTWIAQLRTNSVALAKRGEGKQRRHAVTKKLVSKTLIRMSYGLQPMQSSLHNRVLKE